MEEKGENVTIPVLSKYKFCLKFIKLGRLTDSPLPPSPPPRRSPSEPCDLPQKSYPPLSPLSPLPQEINNNWSLC